MPPETPKYPEHLFVHSLDELEEVHTPLEFAYNKTEAHILGLEQMEVPVYQDAQRLIEQIIDKTIDISTTAGKTQFVQAWQSQCPDIPMPAVLKNTADAIVTALADADLSKSDFWYLTQLQSGKIITNLEGHNQPAIPQFDKREVVLVDSWTETDYNAPDAAAKHTSKLIKQLMGQDSTVNIKREDLDAALWKGDPAKRIPTDKHKALLQKLGVDPTQFELRCIRQDEYARGAGSNNWGQKILWTNFDHYFLEDGGARCGLSGGYRDGGGSSSVDCNWRDDTNGDLAVRLVLSRK